LLPFGDFGLNNPRILIILFIIFGLFATIGGIMLTYVCNTLMTDLDYNSWIERVDKSWSGAIPATLIYNKEQRVFLEQELTLDELFENVNQIMN